jgi:DNA/RNA endonuclease YhcR with UshA esterase domain
MLGFADIASPSLHREVDADQRLGNSRSSAAESRDRLSSGIDTLQGKIIGITGIIELHQGKPEIKVTSGDQLKSLDSQAISARC